ncbi:MAG: bifunctional folylpolyglutamate synthase/dihydrofolate synthase [Firmicutes bacterium]|nr:bifunctional folylpolyglutamate synthase/dihydrofolate synthase [Bacillota bacterium]
MNETEALAWIHSMSRFPKHPGLARMRRLMALLGDPQKQLRCFHVAGTNGKGSTCAMLASCLRSAGYRTGLYISPFVVDFRERMQIDGNMIAPQELAMLAEQVRPAVDRLCAENDPPAEFEVVTAIAFCWYARQRCDYVVLEVGLGGRLDATNVIDAPVVSVICTIDYDHTAVLGDTLTKIAWEKCGILKEGGIAVFSPQTDEAEAAIRAAAEEKHVSLFRPDPSEFRVFAEDLSGSDVQLCGMRLRIPLIGRHQLINCATAVAALLAAKDTGVRISEEQIRQGIAAVRFPARLELLGDHPAVLLDGAHNPSGARALADAIRQHLNGKRCVAVMGMLRDKDYTHALAALVPCFDKILTLTPDSPRALPAEELAASARLLGGDAEAMETPSAAIAHAVGLAGKDGAVVVCGSLFLAASLRPLLQQL